MLLEELERRLQVLEDSEAIKRLKSRYAQAVDSASGEEVEKLFTEDAVWNVAAAGGVFKGRKAIRESIENKPQTLPFTVHYFVQPDIRVDGDRAYGQWYMLVASTTPDGTAIWSSGVEDDKYEKVDGEWLISELKLIGFFRTPYEEGWHKKRFID